MTDAIHPPTLEVGDFLLSIVKKLKMIPSILFAIEKSVYLVTEQLPIDMDLALIIDDTINQYKHKTPMPLKSKSFKKTF